MENSRKWVFQTVAVFWGLLLGLGSITVVVDPYFHYHKPLKMLEYPLDSERYQNDGITRNFEYDAIITGSSMTQNFKTSEADELFGIKSIKIPYSGARYKEVDQSIRRAISRNNQIKYVIRGLDFTYLLRDKDEQKYEDNPEYLYDDFVWNDVYYIFNKEILLEDVLDVFEYTKEGEKMPSFDQYTSWGVEGGKDVILESYKRPDKVELQPWDEGVKARVEQNVEQNVLMTVKENPQVEFYFFFPPYSIYYWDSLYCDGTIGQQLAMQRFAIEMLLEYENVRLFSLYDDFETICNEEIYRDIWHYNADINSKILQCMKNGKHEVTKDNYQEYCEKTEAFYLSYDYDSLFN